MKQGDIILFPIPQADGKIKQRPVLLLKKMPGYGDWLVCGISSQLHQYIKGFDLVLDTSHPDFNMSGLKSPGLIRLGFLSIISSEKIPGSIGSLSKETFSTLLNTLSKYLSEV